MRGWGGAQHFKCIAAGQVVKREQGRREITLPAALLGSVCRALAAAAAAMLVLVPLMLVPVPVMVPVVTAM